MSGTVLIRTLRSFGVLLALALLVACQPPQQAADGIVRGERDDRDYRYVELPNRMRVLLVSDPGSDKAAAALQVLAGSGDDPVERQGLAHFLEHMLFLGTGKYPDPAGYMKFISEHGGSHNAFTAIDNTTYFFDIEPGSLAPALDRFSRFFIDPLFNAEYVGREVNAVDSEYRMGLKEDSRREFDILRELVQPGHPLAKLGVGNLQTLGDGKGDIRQDLLDFHARHYSANLMTLVVLGRESTVELEALVRAHFAEVKDTAARARTAAPPLFAPGKLPLAVSLRPEKDVRELSLLFPVPSARAHYAAKPLEYIGNLLGHEGAGSLLSLLKARGWAEGLSAGSGFDMYGQDLFQVSVQLTPDGLAHQREIVALVFADIERIRDGGIAAWRFDEQRRLGDLAFRFREKGDPSGTVIMLAEAMRSYPVADVLRGPYAFRRFDGELIRRYLDALRPDNVAVMLSHRDAVTDRESAWFKAPYAVAALDAASLALAPADAAAALALPAVNEFVPETVALKPAAATPPAVPQLLVDTPRQRLWYQQDGTFGTPRGVIRAQLFAAVANGSARNAALAQLYARLLSDQLNEYAYPASLAGLDYAIDSNNRGLGVQVGGYDDKQRVLLAKVLQALGRNDFAPERFDSLKRELLRGWRNTAKNRPFQRLAEGLRQSLVQRDHAPEELVAALEPLGLGDLQAFLREFHAQPAMELLVYGNYREDEARAIAAQIASALAITADTPAAVPDLAVAELPAGRTGVRDMAIEHADSAALLYVQGRGTALADRALSALTAQILAARFFDELRTERQLGYAVFAQSYPIHRVPGLVFVVQSPVAGPVRLASEIDAFLTRAAAGAPDAAEFARHRQALIDRLRERPKSLAEQADDYWADIVLGNTDFADREHVATAAAAIDAAQWQAYFRTHVAGPARRAAFLFSRGQAHAAEPAAPAAAGRFDLQAWREADAKYYRFGWPPRRQDF